MSQYHSLMLQSLRDEIAFFNAQIQLMVVIVTLVTVTAYIVAHHPTFKGAALLIPFAIGSGLFAIGRADLLMHRAGAFVAHLETLLGEPLTWEVFKASRAATSMLPLYDVAGLTLWAFLLIWAERRAWRELPPSLRIPFVVGTLGLVFAGAFSIAYAVLAS